MSARLDAIERELGLSGKVEWEEARRARVTLRLLRDDVKQALDHRRAVDTDGQRVGHGGPLGTCPPSALAHLLSLLDGPS